MSQRKLPVQKFELFQPPLEEVAKVLQNGLEANFAEVCVRVIDCPDLTAKPFMLTQKGLCGSPRVADIGGVPYLMPLVQKDKKYNFDEVAELLELPDACIVGAGAGPAHVVGVNSELMPNLTAGRNGMTNTHCCRIVDTPKRYDLQKLESRDFMVLMNIFACEGKPGQVLEVNARNRTGPANLVDCMQKAMTQYYGAKPVGLGGTFLIESGKANIHVMPDFSEVPLTNNEEVDNWLQFFEMNSPLVALGYFMTYDPDLDLRMEHFHCFSEHGDGGHYHWDTTPGDASYRGYFNIPQYMYRIDRPQHTHRVGRD